MSNQVNYPLTLDQETLQYAFELQEKYNLTPSNLFSRYLFKIEQFEKALDQLGLELSTFEDSNIKLQAKNNSLDFVNMSDEEVNKFVKDVIEG